MGPKPLRHPFLFAADGVRVLPFGKPRPQHVLEAGARENRVLAQRMHSPVGLVADHQAIVLVEKCESLGDALERIAQQRFRLDGPLALAAVGPGIEHADCEGEEQRSEQADGREVQMLGLGERQGRGGTLRGSDRVEQGDG